jgi:hypothetical protein
MLLIYSGYSSTAQGKRRSITTCVCGAVWSRVVARSATSTARTLARAQRDAVEFLDRALADPPDEPCPACGAYSAKQVARMRAAVWEFAFYLNVMWLGVLAVGALLFAILHSDLEPSASSQLIKLITVGGGFGLSFLFIRRIRQRGLNPNHNANTRRGRLHDPLQVTDVTMMLHGIRHEAPEEIERAIGLFTALSAAGGWSIDAALAESLRRCLSDGRIPPSLLSGLRSLNAYGETPAIDAWLGMTPLR